MGEDAPFREREPEEGAVLGKGAREWEEKGEGGGKGKGSKGKATGWVSGNRDSRRSGLEAIVLRLWVRVEGFTEKRG